MKEKDGKIGFVPAKHQGISIVTEARLGDWHDISGLTIFQSILQ